ncbi:hypothetical protein [Haloarcula laminariae]|uniref:hypothetical protein n=1 Tax=Haloarcula laminariae TaxID=2961577 RepID=UPI0021C719DD|nr:hypothetical protein [Halomicroarcula laminariae]
MPTFGDYKDEGQDWITFVEADYYPDYLIPAKEKYKEDMEQFGKLIERADSSADVLRIINNEWTTTEKQRTQLLRIFRRYISPDTSVEMMKKKKNESMVIDDFGHKFRDIEDVRDNWNSRPQPDGTLAALLDQHSDRGFKGYWVEEQVFKWFEENFSDDYELKGPRGAGRDIELNDVLEGYEHKTPADFVLYGPTGDPELVGFARYDSDRGGAQEDDRTGGNANTVTRITEYSQEHNLDLKVLFVNDGPGLLLGSMWDDYARIEESAENVKVCTLDMLDARISEDWVLSDPVSESDDVIDEEALEGEKEPQASSDGGESQSGFDQFK